MFSRPTMHMPYDGSSKPFTIGLKPLELSEWLEVDDQWPHYIAEKQRFYSEIPDKVLVAENNTADAQQEVFNLVVEHLATHFPQINVQEHEGFEAGPLARAALLVQEDLVLMRKSPEGWRLVAASLCFPSAWNLLEKFRKPLHHIHAPVPEFGEGTRNASLIERMFDNLRVDNPVIRWNWSLHDDMKLYHPHSNSGPGRRFGEHDLRGQVILRLERQTLRKLPKSGDILFTIRIQVNPLEVLEKLADGANLALAIDQQLSDMTPPQLDYKGLSDERLRLSARLKQIGQKQ